MAEKPTLLIVDDEKTTREGLRAALEERYDVYIAEDATAAMTLLEESVDAARRCGARRDRAGAGGPRR